MNLPVSMVLVEPENPDNIGAASRAMKNMGFSDLRLVRPPQDWSERGRKMAVGAKGILEKARVYPSLQAAISDSQLVIGTTRRKGAKRGLVLEFDEALQKICGCRGGFETRPYNKVSIVFGKESKGLANRDLALCDYLTTIPAHPDYPSINLAQAVMIVTFSIFMQRGQTKNYCLSPLHISDVGAGLKPAPTARPIFVSKKEMKEVLDQFHEALFALNYEREGKGVHERIVKTLHRLFKRNGLLLPEGQMFKGLTRRIIERAKENEQPVIARARSARSNLKS